MVEQDKLTGLNKGHDDCKAKVNFEDWTKH